MNRLLLTTASLAAALTLSLSLSGCGSSDEPTGPSDKGANAADSADEGDDPFDQVIVYAKCLRKQGLKVEINRDEGWNVERGTDPRKIEAAEMACRNDAPPGMLDKPSPEQLDKYVQVAKCLRDQGVKVKDPTEDEPQLQVPNPPDNLKQLQEACEKKIF